LLAPGQTSLLYDHLLSAVQASFFNISVAVLRKQGGPCHGTHLTQICSNLKHCVELFQCKSGWARSACPFTSHAGLHKKVQFTSYLWFVADVGL